MLQNKREGTYRPGTLVCFGDLAQTSTEKSRI